MGYGVWIVTDQCKSTVWQWHCTVFCWYCVNPSIHRVYIHRDYTSCSPENLYFGSSHRQYSISCTQPVGHSDVIGNVLTTGWCRNIWRMPGCNDPRCAALFKLFRLITLIEYTGCTRMTQWYDFVSWVIYYQNSEAETTSPTVFKSTNFKVLFLISIEISLKCVSKWS